MPSYLEVALRRQDAKAVETTLPERPSSGFQPSLSTHVSREGQQRERGTGSQGVAAALVCVPAS